jgi:hypothetical protein
LQRCGTPELTLSAEEEAKIRARIDSYGDTEDKIFGTGEVTIDVSFQVIHNGAAGYIADQAITNQINVLNKAYAPYKFQFRLRETRRTDNAALYTACGRGYVAQRQFKPQLRNPSDGPNVLYLYTCDLGPAKLLGYATFPTDYENDPLLDGVVCSYTTLPGGRAPFDLGHTASHEVGHWCVTAACPSDTHYYPLLMNNMIHHADRHFAYVPTTHIQAAFVPHLSRWLR